MATWIEYRSSFPENFQSAMASLIQVLTDDYGYENYESFRTQSVDLREEQIREIPPHADFWVELADYIKSNPASYSSYTEYEAFFPVGFAASYNEVVGVLIDQEIGIEGLQDYPSETLAEHFKEALPSTGFPYRFEQYLHLSSENMQSQLSISQQPESMVLCQGDEASLYIGAEGEGEGELSYQWYEIGKRDAVGSSANLNLSSATVGVYKFYVVVTAPGGAKATSETVEVTVNKPVSITAQPQNVQTEEGQPFTLSVSVSGTKPLQLQWYRNGEPISGATSTSYSVPGAKIEQAGSYHCVVTNVCGSVSSQSATVVVSAAPKIFTISGSVVNANGVGQTGKKVKAFDMTVNDELELATTDIDGEGSFTLTYSQTALASPEKGTPDLLLKVYETGGAEPIWTSGLLADFSADREVKIVLDSAPYVGKSEYQQLEVALASEIASLDLSQEVSKERVITLANRTSTGAGYVKTYLLAKTFAQQTSTDPRTWYALMRGGLQYDKSFILSSSKERMLQAYRKAAAGNAIEPSLEEDAEVAIDSFNSVRIALEVGSGSTSPTRRLLDNSVIPETKYTTVTERLKSSIYANKENALASLLADGTLTQPEADDLVETAAITTIADRNTELVTALKANPSINKAKDTVKLTSDDWFNLINGSQIEVPENISGADESERMANYAESLERRTEEIYPSQKFTYKVQEEESGFLGISQQNYQTFFENNPDFDFRKQTVQQYLNENSEALNNVTATDFEEKLQASQRLFNLTPQFEKFEAAKELLGLGHESARSIVAKGRAAFIAEASVALGSTDKANSVFNNASRKDAGSKMVLAGFHSAFGGSAPSVVPSHIVTADTNIANIPNLEALFGSQDYCACEHCQSVYGAAAYLTDLLKFMENVPIFPPVGEIDTLYKMLIARRPDIANLFLNCENTNTAMPHIDIIIEVLENIIADSPNNIRQTTRSTKELKAAPEHLNAEVYTGRLNTPRYPAVLPYNLWLEEMRMYLDHMGVGMERFINEIPGFTPGVQVLRNLYASAEHLGLNSGQLAAVTDNDLNNSYLYFGLADNDAFNSIIQVDKLLEALNIRLATFEEYLATWFVNSDNQGIIIAGQDCDLSSAEFSLTDQVSKRHRLYQFHRLRLASGLTSKVLDLALLAYIGEYNDRDSLIDNGFIEFLAGMMRLVEDYDADPEEVVMWWSSFSLVQEYLPEDLYSQLFVNPSINTPLQYVSDKFSYENLPNQVLTFDATDTSVKTLILGAINLNSDELNSLVLAGNELPDDNNITLDNLSALFRIAHFTRTVGITVEEYLLLRSLTGYKAVIIKNFPDVSPSDTRAFIDAASVIDSSDFSVKDLLYLTKNPAASPVDEDVYFDLTWATELIESVREEFGKIGVPINLGNPRGDIDEVAQDFVRDDGSYTAPGQTHAVALAALIREPSSFDQTAKDVILNNALPLGVASELRADFDDALGLSDEDERILQLANIIKKDKIRNYIAEALGAVYDQTPAVVLEMMKRLTYQNENLYREFLSDSFLFSSEATKEINFPVQYAVLRKMDKVLRLLNGLGINSIGQSNLILGGTEQVAHWLNLDDLPVIDGEATVAFEELYPILKAHVLDLTIFNEGSSAFTYFAAAQDQEYSNQLSDATGWTVTEAEDLVSAFNFPNLYGGDFYRDERWLWESQKARLVLKKLGVDILVAKEWNRLTPNESTAVAVRNTVKARYNLNEWYRVAPELRDRLRVSQRHALQEYVLHYDVGNPFKDHYDLYNYFLLDTDMATCAMTSRVKEAISAAQLLMQRAILNLETDVTISHDQLAEWQWRKSYRVWEANRKVFLYPENFLEPELRDDKTELFQALEEGLTQQDVTEELVENLYRDYLNGLNEVAKLEVKQFYIDQEDQTHYVFARTKSEPHVYYFRKFVRLTYWTGWQKVDVDIKGDHLLPVKFKGRLFLFWMDLKDQPEPQPGSLSVNVPSDDTANKTTPVQPTYTGEGPVYGIGINLCWSEYKNGRWAPSSKTKSQLEFSFAELNRFQSGEKVDHGLYSMYSDNRNKDNISIGIRIGTDDGKSVRNPMGVFFFDSQVKNAYIRRLYLWDPLPLSAAAGLLPDELNAANHVRLDKEISFIYHRNVPYASFDARYLNESYSYESNSMIKIKYLDGEFKIFTTLSNSKAENPQIIWPHQFWGFWDGCPMFYQDHKRVLFCLPWDEGADPLGTQFL